MDKFFRDSIFLTEEYHGLRADIILTKLYPDYSRSKLSQWIKQGMIMVNGRCIKPKEKLQLGDSITVAVTYQDQVNWQGQDIKIDIIYQDNDIVVVNKQAGLVVHPAAGHHDGTLVNALLYHFPELSTLPRAGLIHRLDKDTTGLLVIAKNLTAHNHLISDMQQRKICRQYQAVAQGVLAKDVLIDAPIGRHPVQRTKMAVLEHGGKSARTHCHVLQRFLHHTHLHLKLDTGRTHQIRVHMKHIHHPLVGDPNYAKQDPSLKNATKSLSECLQSFNRQALHAWQLSFMHPNQLRSLHFEAPMPDDMKNLLATLKYNEQISIEN